MVRKVPVCIHLCNGDFGEVWDVMPLPPSACAESGTGTACLPTSSRIGVRFGRTVTVGHCTCEVYPTSASRTVQCTCTYGTCAHFAAVSPLRSRLFRRFAPAVAPDTIDPISR